jgi:hypothetical protein
LHATLAEGTLHAIYRQACRFVPAADLQQHFFTGELLKETRTVDHIGQGSGSSREKKNKRRKRRRRHK